MFTMTNPVAIITGAGSGIGRATAVELARREYRLVLAGRNPEPLRETLQIARLPDARGIAVAADVSREDDVKRLVNAAVERFGRIDAIVHAAGLAPVRPIGQMSSDEWRAVLDTNLSAAFYLCREAWGIFQKQRGGVVVNVSSLAARDPFSGFAAYGAAKAGLNLFGLAAAREGEAIGVRVHTIAPGAVETPMLRKILTTEQYPREKTLAPEDVAQTIAQCVAGELKYTSGEVIYVHRTL